MKLDILIIDDKVQKIDALRQVIIPLFSDDRVLVDEAHTIAEAREIMREHTYDMAILDMVIPEHDGEEPSHTAGAEFLTEIYDNDDVQKPLQIIGLTEYEEEYSRQQAEFRDRLWYLLFYSPSKLEWKKMLKAKVLQLAKMKSGFMESIENNNKYDVGIICVLSEEFEQMEKAFDGCVWDDCRLPGLPFLFRTTTVDTAMLHTVRVIAVCADRPGACSTSILATAMYTVAKVDTLFMTGVTAAVDDGSVKLNDVIISDSVGDFATATRILSAASAVVRDQDLCNDINDEMVKQQLITCDTKVRFQIAKTVDSEGHGLYLTAHSLAKQALWMKSVCDFTDRNNGESYHKSCSYASAAFLYQMLREKF